MNSNIVFLLESFWTNEFFALSEEAVPGFVSKQTGDVTLVKDLKFMDSYNKKIEESLSGKVEDFRVIYI